MSAERRAERTLLGITLVLTFSTGVADAVGYLGLDRVFAGNMTGNVVILGMAITGVGGLPIAGPAVGLAAFMAGAAIAGRAQRGLAPGWSRRTTVLLCGLAAVLTLLGVAVHLADRGPATVYAATAVLAAVMGAQAAVARHLAVKDVTTVVVTSTITGLAADSRWAARNGGPWPRRVSAICLIGAGAAVGAATVPLGLAPGVLLSAALTLGCAVTGQLLCASSRTP